MASNPKRLRILASRVFDSQAGEFVHDQAITISRVTGLIVDVCPINDLEGREEANSQTDTLDLRAPQVTLLPGLIDTHVHLFLHPYAETLWVDQVTKESTAERTIRAVTHARKTLMAGYTTVRDLGTEGALDADVALRKSISSPLHLIPGPRLFISSKAIVSTGSYGPKGELRTLEEGVDGMHGAEAADGETECRKAVRRQIGAGADWIKIYADYSGRSRMLQVSPTVAKSNIPNFTEPELQVMIETAHSLGVKVAAHASRADVIQQLIRLGIDSIEHGSYMDLQTLKLLQAAARRVTWNPTLATFSPDGPYPEVWPAARESFEKALKLGGIRIGCGGDTGTFPHGENSRELQVMIRAGADFRDVLRWATLGGWECVRGMEWEGDEGNKRLQAFQDAAVKPIGGGESETSAFEAIGEWPLGDNSVPLGCIKPGYAADFVVFWGDFSLIGKGGTVPASVEDLTAMVDSQKVFLVMKAGKIYKLNGIEVPQL